jgi:uncharacterized membrane protein YqgA involved in biofilm formation
LEGVLANPIAIILGTFIGLVFKRFISETVISAIEMGLGFCVLVIGLQMALKMESFLLVTICIASGGIVGTLLQLEKKLFEWGKRVQKKLVKSQDNRFANGLVISSILFCTGAMAVVGGIEAGAKGNSDILYAKSLLDGCISVSFAAIYGVGVAGSAAAVLIYQGAIALLASQLSFLQEPVVLANLSGVGGILVVMIGVTLTGIRKVPLGDFLPSILIALIVLPFFA